MGNAMVLNYRGTELLDFVIKVVEDVTDKLL